MDMKLGDGKIDEPCEPTGCDCEALLRESREHTAEDYPHDSLEFFIRALKGEALVERVREAGDPVTVEGIQGHLWRTLRSRRAGGEKFGPKYDYGNRYYDTLNGFGYSEYPPLKEDEKLRCAVFCEELLREQGALGSHGWYNEGLQKDALEKCGLEPLEEGGDIGPYNNRAYMEGFFESPYGEKRLREIGEMHIDLRASVWRAAPELRERYPSKTREGAGGEQVPVTEGLPGFEYEHEGWLDMPGFERHPDD
jgi:hypothetical protein